MIAVLAIATVIDLGLAVLLIAVSGFILEGVNNTGPMPGSVWFVAFIVFCIAAPAAAWIRELDSATLAPAAPLADAAVTVAAHSVVLLAAAQLNGDAS